MTRKPTLAIVSMAILSACASSAAHAEDFGNASGVRPNNNDSTWAPPVYEFRREGESSGAASQPLPPKNARRVVATPPDNSCRNDGSRNQLREGACIPDAGTNGAGKAVVSFVDNCGIPNVAQVYCYIPPPVVVPPEPPKVVEPSKPQESQPEPQARACINGGAQSGQVACPTESCFFYVSGVLISDRTNIFGIPSTMALNDASSTWELSTGTAGGDIVGMGSYPDAYGSAQNPGPFYHAANGTFDGIAIGRNTRVEVFDGTNFSGGKLFDKTGPLIVNNMYFPEDYGLLTQQFPNDPIYNQFPPETRFVSSDPSIGLQDVPTNLVNPGMPNPRLWRLSGMPQEMFPGLAFGRTSIRVTCGQ
jgi:hypothetical protein